MNNNLSTYIYLKKIHYSKVFIIIKLIILIKQSEQSYQQKM
jgi:hypothetical protein